MATTHRLTPEAEDIFQRLDALGLKQKALADELGLEPTKISKARTGERQFKAAEVLKARDWLAKHERVPDGYLKALPANPVGAEPDILPTRSAGADDVVDIIALDMAYALGDGTNIDDYIESEPVKFGYSFIRSITHSPPHRLRLAKGVGDSMFPTLQTNDRVMIDTTQNRLNLDDRVYAITRFGAGSIKRLRAIGPNRVLVISDNPNVDNVEMDADDLIIHGRVIWFSRDL